MDEPDCTLALARAPGLTLDALRAAGADDAPGRLIGRPAGELAARGLPPAAAAWLADPDPRTLREDRQRLARAGIALVGCNATAYPPLLRRIPAAPAVLYLRGAAGIRRSSGG